MKAKGFTLVELLIVIAVLAILAAIAYPMYGNYAARAACDSGKSGLLQADALMNQIYTKYGVYNRNTNEEIKEGKLVGMEFIPIDGSLNTADFTLAISNLSAKQYTITATVSSSGRLGRKGGTLTINQSGQRGGTIGGKDVWTEGCRAL